MYNSMGGVLAGAAVGGGYAYLRGMREGEPKVRERLARVVGSLSFFIPRYFPMNNAHVWFTLVMIGDERDTSSP